MLIAIVLVASIPVSGFIFGLFGSFADTALVSAGTTTCSISAGSCTVTLMNAGSASTTLTGCSLQNDGAPDPTSSTGAAVHVPAGKSTDGFTCTVTNPVVERPDSQAIGSFFLSNGATITFVGIWQ